MGQRFRSIFCAIFRKRELDAEMNEEMRGHIELRTQQNLEAGMSPEEARFAALRQFGWMESIKETCRENRGVTWFEHLVQDVRYGARMLRKNPGFAAAAILTLALGIGLNTAIFSVAYGVLWRPLPYPNADRLVVVSSTQRTETGVRSFWTWTPTTYEALRKQVTSFDSLAAYSSTDAQLTGRGEPLQLHSLEVSPNFFATLGVNPARGRAFLTGAGAPDDDHTAIISDRLWRTALQADPAIIGQSITLDGLPRTIVGVLPPSFTFRPVIRVGSLPETDIFLPNRWPGDTGRDAFLFLLGRVKPGVMPERIDGELTTLVNNPAIAPIGAMAMEGAFAPNVRTVARTVGLQAYGAESVRKLLLILLGAVSFLLLIACVNVANLQIARLSARRGELSVRMALGAGSRRIVRQLLTEAVVLSLLGGLLGVVIAQIAIVVALPLVPHAALPRLGGIVIDMRMMAFCLGLSLVSTLLTGLVPALRVSGAEFGARLALHAGETRTTGDRQGEQLRTGLVAAQIAMTLVLLTGAGLLIHSFLRLASVSPGFVLNGPDGVVQVVKVTLPRWLYDEPARIHAFARSALDRIQYLPGVKSASLVNSPPFGMMFIRDEFEVDGQPKPTFDAGRPKIDAGYFQTMGIPLIAGRDFTAMDTPAAPKVAIISERIARECFPGGAREALGRHVRLGDHGEWLAVVGVVADVRQMGLDGEVQPMIYVPFQQERSEVVRFVSFVARTATPGSVVEGMRTEIRCLAPDLPIENTVTMGEAVAASVASPRFRMSLLALFAGAATLIAMCGIYGMMDYAVTQRRREIGVRMALGAERREVLRLVLMRALRIVGIGLLAGLAGAAAITRVLQTFLFGVSPTDPISFAFVTMLLMGVALMAAWLPALRATKIDPSVALRAE